MAGMRYSSALCAITFRDLEMLHEQRSMLRMAYEGIAATQAHGKPAILGLLEKCDDIAEALMRKGATRAVKLGAAGAYTRKQPSRELVDTLIRLARAQPDADGAAAGSSAGIAEAGDAESRDSAVDKPAEGDTAHQT
jgi:hypothetical protein